MSSAPFVCSRELLASSGIICSTFFKSLNYDYLLTITANRLNIYSVHHTTKSHGTNSDIKYYLVHRLSNQLYGKPHDVYPITISSPYILSGKAAARVTNVENSTPQHQHILITFDCGKVVVFNYNHQFNQITVMKIYNAEHGALGENAIDINPDSLSRSMYPGIGTSPFISYDPANEISAITLYAYKILFLSHQANPYRSALMPNKIKPFATDLTTLNLPGAIIDICFLHGYNRPTIAVLQDTGALPVGHAYQVRHTCCVTVLAVDMITESCVVMWKQDELPHDCIKLLLPGDGICRGGVLVVSMNAVLVVTQESVHGLATNGFAKVTVNENIPLVPWPLRPGIELHASRWVNITPPHNLSVNSEGNDRDESLSGATTYLVSLNNGMLLLLRMQASGGETVCGGNVHYDVEIVAQSIPASCLSVLHLHHVDSPTISVDVSTSLNNSIYSSLVLLGSTVADSLLLHTTLTVTTESVINQSSSKTSVRLFSQVSSNDLSENSIISGLGSSNIATSVYSTPNIKRQRKGSWQSPFATPNGESKTFEIGSDTLFIQLAKQEDDWLYTGSKKQSKPPLYLLNPNELIKDCDDFSSSKSSQQSDLVTKKKFIRVNFQLHDSLVAVGPILSGDVVTSDDSYNLGFSNVAWTRDDILRRNQSVQTGPSSIAAYIVDREQKEVLQLCTGLHSESSLVKITQGKRMSKVAARNFFDISSLSSLYVKSCHCMFLLLSREGGGSVQYLAQGMGRSANLASIEGNTRVIKVNERLSQNSKKVNEIHFHEMIPESSCFIHDQRTISIGYVLETKEKLICIQACCKGLRVIQITPGESSTADVHPSDAMVMTPLHDCLLEEDIELGGMGGIDNTERILYADFSSIGGWVSVLTTFGVIYVLQYQPNDESLELKFKFISNEANKPIQAHPPSAKLSHQEVPLHCKLISVSIYTGALPLRYDNNDLDITPSISNEEGKGLTYAEKCKLEEEILYGEAPLSEKEISRTTSTNLYTYHDQKKSKEGELGVYLVIVDRMGSTSFVQISSWTKYNTEEVYITPKKLFQTPPLGSLPNLIRVTSIPDHSINENDEIPQVPKRFATEARLCMIGRNDESSHHRQEELRLCLVTILNTGDVLIYSAIEDMAPPHSLSLFTKLEHSYATRRRRAARSNAEKLRKAARGESLNSSPPDILGLGFTVFQSMLTTAYDCCKGTVVTISGVHPLVLSNEKGIPNVQSLGLPELPYAGSGMYIMSPFYYGSISGLAVLWREEKLDLNDPNQLMLSGGLRAVSTLSTLGLYQDIPDLISLPYSNTSISRQHVGYTTHKVTEFFENRAEDATQKALLKLKTYLLSCSQNIEKNFENNVFTTEEIAQEEGVYDRFFPDLTSFSNPINEIGAPPKLNEVEYRLSIMQNGIIVDSYTLPKGEKILDSTVLYLTIADKSLPPPPPPPPSIDGSESEKPPLIGKKRVFVAACTGIDDKHGEDSQGEGRLLFFALDYAMYREDELTENTNTSEIESKDNTSTDQQPGHERGISAAQKKFYGSIKPKLRLLWSGPGPGTVVAQFKEEYVLCTVGSSIYIYQLNQDTMELDQIAFIFAQFYISTVNIIKDYILIGDACRSVQFVVWRERDNSLTLLGKDYEQAPCLSSGFILDNEMLGLVVGDNEGNIHLMRYNPRAVETKKGFKLLNIADFHIGSMVTSLIPRRILDLPTGLPYRSKIKSLQLQSNNNTPRSIISSSTTPSATSTIVLGSRLEKNVCSKSCLIFGTADGSVGVLLPLDERIYRRLAVLQQLMYTTQPMCCCLNPNEYRALKVSKHRNEKKRGVLDGNLLWSFINFEESLQDELASALGTTADAIIENLEELDMLSLFF